MGGDRVSRKVYPLFLFSEFETYFPFLPTPRCFVAAPFELFWGRFLHILGPIGDQCQQPFVPSDCITVVGPKGKDIGAGLGDVDAKAGEVVSMVIRLPTSCCDTPGFDVT
jgi:hypothetical protein